MYPTIVIYLVNQQRSLVEVFMLSNSNGNDREVPTDRTVTISALAFACSEIVPESMLLREPAGIGFGDTHTCSVIGSQPIETVTKEKTPDMV